MSSMHKQVQPTNQYAQHRSVNQKGEWWATRSVTEQSREMIVESLIRLGQKFGAFPIPYITYILIFEDHSLSTWPQSDLTIGHLQPTVFSWALGKSKRHTNYNVLFNDTFKNIVEMNLLDHKRCYKLVEPWS